MKRMRLRRWARWAGLLVCIVLATGFVMGLRWTFGRDVYWSTTDANGSKDHFRTIMVFAGAFDWSKLDTASTSPEPATVEWFWRRAQPVVHWWPARGSAEAWIPLWIPFVIVA